MNRCPFWNLLESDSSVLYTCNVQMFVAVLTNVPKRPSPHWQTVNQSWTCGKSVPTAFVIKGQPWPVYSLIHRSRAKWHYSMTHRTYASTAATLFTRSDLWHGFAIQSQASPFYELIEIDTIKLSVAIIHWNDSQGFARSLDWRRLSSVQNFYTER